MLGLMTRSVWDYEQGAYREDEGTQLGTYQE